MNVASDFMVLLFSSTDFISTVGSKDTDSAEVSVAIHLVLVYRDILH